MKNLPGETKPCPFCGSDKIRGKTGNSAGNKYYEVRCFECGGRMRQPHKEPALEMWNRRSE